MIEREIIGKTVMQARCSHHVYRRHIGRTGTVDQVVKDEKGVTHCRTAEDGVWCPVDLLDVIESRKEGSDVRNQGS